MYCKAPGGLTVQQPVRHIVADKGCVILPHRDRGVVERRQRVRLDVADLGGVAFQAIHDIADMFTVQFQEPAFDRREFSRIAGKHI